MSRHRAGTAVIEKGRQSVDEILDAATALLAEEGYAELSTRKVAARAGMRPGNLQYYFPAKRDMVRALLDRYLARSLERLAGRIEREELSPEGRLRQVIAHLKAQISPTAPADERLRQFVLADLHFMDRHQDEYMLMVGVFYGANFLYGHGTSYFSVAIGAYREFFAMLEDILGKWMGPGQLEKRGGQVVAFQVLALIESANLAAWASPGEPVDRKRDADRIMAMLNGGLGPVES